MRKTLDESFNPMEISVELSSNMRNHEDSKRSAMKSTRGSPVERVCRRLFVLLIDSLVACAFLLPV